MPGKLRDGITYLLQNCNFTTVGVWESKNDFISHFMMDLVIYTYIDKSYPMLENGVWGKSMLWCVKPLTATHGPLRHNRQRHPLSISRKCWIIHIVGTCPVIIVCFLWQYRCFWIQLIVFNTIVPVGQTTMCLGTLVSIIHKITHFVFNLRFG